MKELLKSNRQHLQKLWFDKATVIRSVKITKPNGATGYEDEKVYKDIPCHYSQSSSGTDQTTSSNNIEYSHKLFYGTEIEILPGDTILINIKDSGIVREFVRTGEPTIYFSHNACTLERKEHA